MPEKNWNIFLEILRSGLWGLDLSLPDVASSPGWDTVLALGREQAVMGLLLRGIAQLPEDQRPSGPLAPLLQAWETAFARANARYAHVQGALLKRLSEAGLHPVVQKGTEAAKYYSDPSIRQVGDIDLYLPGDEFRRARALFPDARRASDGAVVFALDGVTVELHPRYYDIHLPASKLPAVGSPCGEVLLLSSHIFKHAMGPGIGCKQLCDLAVAMTRLECRYGCWWLISEWIRPAAFRTSSRSIRNACAASCVRAATSGWLTRGAAVRASGARSEKKQPPQLLSCGGCHSRFVTDPGRRSLPSGGWRPGTSGNRRNA